MKNQNLKKSPLTDSYLKNLSTIRANEQGDLLLISLRKFIVDIQQNTKRPLSEQDQYIIYCYTQFHIARHEVPKSQEFTDFYKKLILLIDSLLCYSKER